MTSHVKLRWMSALQLFYAAFKAASKPDDLFAFLANFRKRVETCREDKNKKGRNKKTDPKMLIEIL